MKSSFFSKFFLGEWNVGIANQDFLELFSRVQQGGTLVLDVKWMKHNHHNSFYADPFIYKVDRNNVKILVEEFFFDRGKGVISLLDIDRKSGKLLNKCLVLEETCHLSYPFYDNNNGTFIPESFRNNNLVEYDFDGKTVSRKQIISNFPLIDATPVKFNGKWYIFATSQPNALDELLIYWSDKREGPYRSHPLNPQKKDIMSSRCGGKFFEYRGELFRPVQDSTNRYGETMHIMKVSELSPIAFREEYYCHVQLSNPGRYNMGFHTLNFLDNIILVDGYRENFRPFQVLYNVKIARYVIKK